MPDEREQRRGNDRRKGDAGYTGLERRSGDRRKPDDEATGQDKMDRPDGAA